MKLFTSLILLSSVLIANDDYHKLLDEFPETLGRHGSWRQGEIEIATSPDEIKKIQKHCYQKFLRKGYSKEVAEKYSTAGIITEDHYWIWVRDAVTFPGGIPGTYDRIILKSGLTGPPKAVVLPVLANNKVIVNISFSHATRSWEMELPRGSRESSETAEQAALRELKEETGYSAEKLIKLGTLAPETGVVSGIIPVYFSRVQQKKARHQEESEAIAINMELTLDEIQSAFDKGYLTADIKGDKTKVFCRDPFLSFAILQAMWKKLI